MRNDLRSTVGRLQETDVYNTTFHGRIDAVEPLLHYCKVVRHIFMYAQSELKPLVGAIAVRLAKRSGRLFVLDADDQPSMRNDLARVIIDEMPIPTVTLLNSINSNTGRLRLRDSIVIIISQNFLNGEPCPFDGRPDVKFRDIISGNTVNRHVAFCHLCTSTYSDSLKVWPEDQILSSIIGGKIG